MFFETSDHVRLHFLDEGSGPALFLLNGLWGDVSMWTKQIPVFSKNFRCIRVDHRGVAQSERWTGDYSYDLHARDVIELADHLGIDRFHAAGACHGGMVAATLAKNHPQRLLSVVINAANILADKRVSLMFEGWRHILEASDFDTLYRSVILPAIMSGGFIARNIGRIDFLLHGITKNITKEAALPMIDAAAAFGLTPAEVSELRTPALLISGNEDLFSPPFWTKTAHKLWKGSRYAEFPACGHFPQRECTTDYNRTVMAFLQSRKQPDRSTAADGPKFPAQESIRQILGMLQNLPSWGMEMVKRAGVKPADPEK
jgi:pimeloyl-ACP methyl ester carboxylesterase